MFEQPDWHSDRMHLNGLLFRLEHQRSSAWNPADDHFRFFKTRELIDAYARFFQRAAPPTGNILELGLWDGGSLAFWFELLQPRKIVGLDLEPRGDSAYFQRFVRDRAAAGRIRTHWSTNQADAARLRRIVEDEFDAPLDLVFDDASHLYEPTKVSFETLFPLVRPGGFYIIEDWAWLHWSNFRRPPEWSGFSPPTRLVQELVEATGTGRGAIANVEIFPGFVAIERGPRALDASFRLADSIFRAADPPLRKLYNRVVWGRERALLARLKNAVVRTRDRA